jgi:TPP-dependent pyruvate/acetoin dehydrogenase alpha subunit
MAKTAVKPIARSSIKKSSTPKVPLQPDRWIEAARLMLTSRAIDHIEESELVPSGKVTYQFSARGHELSQIMLGLMLDQPHDAAAVY